jgi:hypothetical protein
MGGSPCTHWSIVQTPNRETQPEGMGWELFRNYLIAREERRKFLEGGLQMNIDQEKRMAGDYEIIHALHIGDREIVLGENPSAPEDERYVCAFCQQHEIFANYTEVMVSDDYPELVKLFGERVAEQAEKTHITLNGPKIQGIPNSAITAEDCEQVSYQEDIRGKVVVIRPEVLRREYRHATCQLQLCTSGSGAYPNSRGTACYCTELYSGQRARFERSDILGVIAPEDLPKWAKHYLELRQAEKERNSRDREGR